MLPGRHAAGTQLGSLLSCTREAYAAAHPRIPSIHAALQLVSLHPQLSVPF